MIFLMFISGIFWDIRAVADPELQGYLFTWNPVAFLLDAYRAVLMYGESPDLSHLGGLILTCLPALALTGYLYAALRSAVNVRVINE